MTDESEFTRRTWSRQELVATFRPTRAEIDSLMLAAGSDPRDDLYLDLLHEALARTYGLELSFEVRVEWIWRTEDLRAIGGEAAMVLEQKVYPRIVQQATDELQLELVRQVIARKVPFTLEGHSVQVKQPMSSKWIGELVRLSKLPRGHAVPALG